MELLLLLLLLLKAIIRIQNDGSHQLDFAKMMILATLSTTGCHSAPAYKISIESCHSRHRNDGTLIKSKMAAAAIVNFG